VEVAACVVLLVSSGLLVRALLRVQAVDPGFRSDGVLTMRTSLPFPKYQETAQRQSFYDNVLTQTRALPGVRSAAYISFLPMVMRGGIWKAKAPGSTQELAEINISLRFVTPGFFDSMRIPLKAGRDVSERDTRESKFVAVVSESLARRYWPNENPIGKRLFVSFFDREIVGVAGDIRVRGLERNSEPQVYIPSRQIPDGWMPFYAPKDLVIRGGSNAAALAPSVREIIRRSDPELPVSDVRLLSDIVAADTSTRRVQLWAIGALAALAFALAAIGIHGLLSYSVASRSQEVGIRIALGADRREIVAMFLRQAGALALLGIALGLPVALWVARSLQVLLAGVPAADPVTIGAAVALVAVMTSVGSFVPALRAVSVDPAVAVRGE
jgi:predicted permease